ncbi:MAG: GNAT family N-acetyltransferase [Chloroflexota bacterium]|nr:GNAT family N-acetyltransferase [Chloroflexota bacterium]
MLRIRRYEAPDHDAVWALHNLALEQVGAHAGNGPWDEDLHRIEDAYLRDGGEFLVGVHGERIVAMGAFRRTGPDRAEIKRMRVHPHVQRQGFGRAILAELERRASSAGYRTLQLDTTAGQVGAQHLYRRHGFQETGRTVRGAFDTVLFEKRLREV